MKQLITVFISLAFGILFKTTICAQSPEKVSYQAVVRDANDDLLINQQVGMQISILQGSANGTALYVERHFPTTNANGLIAIIIGNGTILEGLFAEIDWNSGPYFLKTETDLNGGANYTLTATSQLLSVPYALHAKTAETVTGNIPEIDPIFVADSSGIKTVIRMNKQAIQDTANQIRTDMPKVTTYSVGDFAQGGIVFWVDETGHHGLVCAKEDQDGGSGIQWYNEQIFASTEAYGHGVYAGKMNTMLIIVAQGSNSNDYAAGVCAHFSVTENGVSYGDWYLPSKEELNLIYQNKATIDATAEANGGSSFSSEFYWSSTEATDVHVWGHLFADGQQGLFGKNEAGWVRAVRAF